MAYTVGSVSVDVVPDFKNAQNAITAFFRSQPDQFKIPVRPDIDQSAVRKVEAQAQQVGNKVGDAISQGASRGMSSALSNNLSRQIAKLEADIEKARRTTDDATEKLRLAEMRLDEARQAGNRSASTMLSLEQAVERQRRRLSDADRLAAESSARLVAVRRQLGEETARIAEEATRKSAEAQRRADEAAVAAAKRTAERVAAERLKAQEKADQELMRKAERDAKVFERMAVDDARRAAKAAAAAVKENERIQLQIEIDEKRAIEAGRHTGGLIMRSIRHEMHQNAGLIAAVVSGVLLAGAPAALAAASTLFVGIAGVAAAQSQHIRQVWSGLWDQIRTNAVADAAVLVPVFDRMAGAISQSFERMRPLVQEAFAAIGPQIDSFTSSVIDAGENALPGLVRAVQAGDPVIRGLGDLLESIGQGLGDFFDILARNAVESGQALHAFGEVFRELLPLLGQLLNVGASVANNVLPSITTALEALNFVTSSLSGVLPQIITGFLAFRVAQGASRFVGNLASTLATAASSGGMFSTAMSRTSGVLRGLANGLPIVGAAIGVYASLVANGEQQTRAWAAALLEGGKAARQAREDMGDPSFMDKFIFNLTHWGNTQDVATRQTKEATEEYNRMVAAMSPLERAQHRLEQAERNLADARGDSSVSASELARMQKEVSAASADLADKQRDLEMATRGVTEAMVEQADLSRSLVDSSFAYENALNDLEDAQDSYNTALKEGDEEEKSRALLELQEGYAKVAEAAGKVASDSLPALLGAEQRSILSHKAELDSLLELQAAHGDLGPILNNRIAELQAITSQADGAALAQAELAAAFAGVGIAVEAIPGEKTVTIDAPTDEVRAKLEDLGFTITEMPDGSIKVSADTTEAQENLDIIDTELQGLDGTIAEPDVTLNDITFQAILGDVRQQLVDLGLITANPKADLDPSQFNSQYADTTADIETLDSQEPTPTADMRSDPFNAVWGDIMGDVDTLDKQNPTPTASMDNRPFTGTVNGVFARVAELARQNPTPTISARDAASGTISYVQSLLNSLRDRTVTITTIQRTVVQQSFLGGWLGLAEGGAVPPVVPVQKFDVGGSALRFTGATYGRGGPRDDLQPAMVSPGEHILDARDVALMGGQAGVYAFREMLNSGQTGRPSSDTGVRTLLDGMSGDRSAAERTRNVSGFVNNGTIITQDMEAIARQAEMARREMYARELAGHL